MIEYILLGVLAPIFLNLMHMCVGIYVTVARGSVIGLGFSGISFLTKSIAMIFFVWLGVEKLGMDYQIFVPMICFFWFFIILCFVMLLFAAVVAVFADVAAAAFVSSCC